MKLFFTFLALIAAGTWCFLGKMPTTMAGTGIQSGTETLCFIPAEKAHTVETGMRYQSKAGGCEKGDGSSVCKGGGSTQLGVWTLLLVLSVLVCTGSVVYRKKRS